VSITKSVKANGEKVWKAYYRTPDGKSRERWFARKVDAERFLASVTVKKLEGSYVDPSTGRLHLDIYAREWAARQPWRQSTRNHTNSILESHVIATFGHREMRSIKPSEVQAWVGSMMTSGLAPSTVACYFRVMASVMRAATLDRVIAESPCRQVRLPRKETSSSALIPLTSAQVLALADSVDPRFRALVLVSAGLGLRQGEACGLTLDRVDFLRRKVTIDRQMTSVAHTPSALGPVKTEASNRSLPLADALAEVLAEHVRIYRPSPSGLLFTLDSGRPLTRSGWAFRFKRAATELGLSATSHDLRHHSASMLIAAGCSVKAVQHFLGHATAAETLDTYGHLWADDEDRIRSTIDRAMRASAVAATA